MNAKKKKEQVVKHLVRTARSCLESSELMELMKRHSCYAPQHRRKKEGRERDSEREREKEIRPWSGEEGLQSALPL